MSISRTVNCRKTRFKLRQYGKRENIDLTLRKYPAHRYGVQGIFGVVQKPPESGLGRRLIQISESAQIPIAFFGLPGRFLKQFFRLPGMTASQGVISDFSV